MTSSTDTVLAPEQEAVQEDGHHRNTHPHPQTHPVSLELSGALCCPANYQSAQQMEAPLLLGEVQCQQPPKVSEHQVPHAAWWLRASQSNGFWKVSSGESAVVSVVEAEALQSIACRSPLALQPGASGPPSAPRGPQVPGQSCQRISVDETTTS